MRRKACALLLSATLGGCVSSDRMESGPHCAGSWGKQHGPPPVPGVAGPHGQHIPMAAPYNMAPPGNPHAARQMMSNSVPLDMVQINRGGNVPGMSGAPDGSMPFTPIPHGGVLTPPGVPFAPGIPAGPNVGPAGFVPNLGGSNLGGVVPANMPPGAATSGLMLAQHAAQQGHGQVRYNAQRSQIRFTRPTGMKISWFAQGADGKPGFSNVPLEAPARYNFPQGAIYRLKLNGIEGRPGLEVYPTMEVVPANPKTEAFLAHSAVPLEFTQDDFKQIAEGNYVTKVIYLPDPNFQDVAGTGIDEIISTRLEPGADPIQEALRRGSILVIIRMGNVDQEAPNTPPLGAVAPTGPAPGPQAHPNLPPHLMVPYPGYMPKHGGLPPGGPMMGAPVNPLLAAPGFNPNMPPPPGFAPNAPQTGSALPPIPPAPPTNNGNIGAPDLTSAPPPVAPTPTPELQPAPDGAVPLIPPPVAPTPNGAKKPLDITPAFPAVPPVAPALNGSTKSDLTIPGAPASAPKGNDVKKIDATVPPIPSFPSSKTNQLPTVTPASNASLPALPDIDGPSRVISIPATPGMLPPATPMTTPGNSSRPTLPLSDGASR